MGGQAVSFLIIQASEHGSVSNAGQDAAFATIQASDHGSFSHSGQDVAFREVTVLAAGDGSFSLSGQTISVLWSMLIAQGSFALNGQDATLTVVEQDPAFDVAQVLATIAIDDLGYHLLQDDLSWSVSTSAIDRLNMNETDVGWKIKQASKRWNIRKDD